MMIPAENQIVMPARIAGMDVVPDVAGKTRVAGPIFAKTRFALLSGRDVSSFLKNPVRL
jgi:hypothetical protein